MDVRKKLNLPRVIFISLKGTDPSSFKFFSHSILSPETEERKKINVMHPHLPQSSGNCLLQLKIKIVLPNFAPNLIPLIIQVPYHQVSHHFRKLCAHSSVPINISFLFYIPVPYFGFFFFFPKHFPLSMKQTMTFVRKGEPVGGSEFKSY